MANQRGTFAKRNREMKLKDRAREKAERRAERAANPNETKGPQIAWDEAGGTALAEITSGAPGQVTPPPADSDSNDTDS